MGAEISADQRNHADSDAVASPEGSAPVADRPDQLAAGPLAGLLIALLAGAVCWVLLETAFPVFAISDRLANLPTPAPVEDLVELEMANRQAASRNAILFLGILGAVVGGGLAVGEGVARRSGRLILTAVLAGTAVAALFGCLAGLIGHMAFDFHRPIEGLSPLAKTIRTQAILSATLGLGLGLAVGMISRRGRIALTCLVGGLLAGVLAGIVYPMLTAICFPGLATESVVPSQTIGRLVWIAVLTGFAGLVIPGVARQRRPRSGRVAGERPIPPSA
jgi:hypothetical protein